jgi:hypothetical protein
MGILVFNLEPLVPANVPGHGKRPAIDSVMIVCDTQDADESARIAGFR